MPVIQIGENQYNIEPEVFNQYVNKHTKKETSNCFFYKRHRKKLVFKNNIKSEFVIDKLQNYKQNTFYKIQSINDTYFDYYKKLKPDAPNEFATENKDLEYYKENNKYKSHSYNEVGKKTITFE